MRRSMAVIILCSMILSASASAWEKDTQLVIVTTSMHMLAKGGLVQLPKLQKEIQKDH